MEQSGNTARSNGTPKGCVVRISNEYTPAVRDRHRFYHTYVYFGPKLLLLTSHPHEWTVPTAVRKSVCRVPHATAATGTRPGNRPHARSTSCRRTYAGKVGHQKRPPSGEERQRVNASNAGKDKPSVLQTSQMKEATHYRHADANITMQKKKVCRSTLFPRSPPPPLFLYLYPCPPHPFSAISLALSHRNILALVPINVVFSETARPVYCNTKHQTSNIQKRGRGVYKRGMCRRTRRGCTSGKQPFVPPTYAPVNLTQHDPFLSLSLSLRPYLSP